MAVSFIVNDPVTASSIPLVYEKVDFTRTIDGYGFFPDVIFHTRADPPRNIWSISGSRRKATISASWKRASTKRPYKDGNTWTTMERQPAPWWWIPASEHPGHTEQKRSWEIMSAIDGYVAAETAAHNGVLKLKDDKTGARHSTGISRRPSAGPPSEGGRKIFRLHGFPQERDQRPILRHRFLDRRENRQNAGDGRAHSQSAVRCSMVITSRCRAITSTRIRTTRFPDGDASLPTRDQFSRV